MIQLGISEKVALVAQYLSCFVTGFVVAYARCWRLALALTSIIPCMALTGGVLNMFETRYTQRSLKHIADAGSIAEEVISTIRTAHAFGNQRTLSALYDAHIASSHALDVKSAAATGIGVSFFFFVIYSAYGLAFDFGTTLVIHGHATVGVIVNVITAILIGSASLAMLSSEMQGTTWAHHKIIPMSSDTLSLSHLSCPRSSSQAVGHNRPCPTHRFPS